MSRGAARAIFVEKDRENVSLIIRNIATLRYEDRTQVKLTDAYRWVRAWQPPVDCPVAVFLDPPYRDYQKSAPRLNQMIVQLVDRLPAESVIAIEGGRFLDETILPDFASWDIRRYGDTRIAIKIVAASERADADMRAHPADSTAGAEISPPEEAQDE